MSHKPTSVHAESKASKSPVRKQVKTKTTTKRSVNQKSGFVAPKSAGCHGETRRRREALHADCQW